MIKQGVSIEKIKPQAVLAFVIAQPIFAKYGYACIITSGDDGKHSLNSKHYTGEGIDLRSKHLPNDIKGKILSELKARLGENYDVLLENVDDQNEHYHIEYDPKLRPTREAIA